MPASCWHTGYTAPPLTLCNLLNHEQTRVVGFSLATQGLGLLGYGDLILSYFLTHAIQRVPVSNLLGFEKFPRIFVDRKE